MVGGKPLSKVWWYSLVFPEIEKLRQGKGKAFDASLSY